MCPAMVNSGAANSKHAIGFRTEPIRDSFCRGRLVQNSVHKRRVGAKCIGRLEPG